MDGKITIKNKQSKGTKGIVELPLLVMREYESGQPLQGLKIIYLKQEGMREKFGTFRKICKSKGQW